VGANTLTAAPPHHNRNSPMSDFCREKRVFSMRCKHCLPTSKWYAPNSLSYFHSSVSKAGMRSTKKFGDVFPSNGL
jgi:hypothetical protein